MLSITTDVLWWEPCHYCRGNPGSCQGGFCEMCHNTGEYPEDISTLATLAHNLAIAAALCRAFRLGFDEGWSVTGEGFNGEYARLTAAGYERLATTGTHDDGRPEWRPGCQRSAP